MSQVGGSLTGSEGRNATTPESVCPTSPTRPTVRSGKVRVCALMPYAVGVAPSQRFRLEQWAPYCAVRGVEIDFLPFADPQLMRMLYRPGHLLGKAAGVATAFFRRIADVARVGRYDVVVVHRAVCLAGPAVFERVLPLFRRPVIFDFDDAIFHLDTSAENRRFGWMKFPGKTSALCRLSTHVTAGNQYLAAYARARNRRVTVVPSSVDTDRFRPLLRAPKNRVTVGWTGSSTSQYHLEAFAPVLATLCRQYDIEVRVHSNRPPDLPGVPATWRPWSEATEPEELGAFDIGIMPLPDTEWALGKCAMKVLLYMAMGVPVVCSPVGANAEIIRDGENGLLAGTAEAWHACLGALIEAPPLRDRLGAAGRRTVEERFSMKRSADRFAEVVRITLQGS